MFDSQETNRLRDLVQHGAVLDKSTVLSMLTELEARGNKVVNLEKSIQRVRHLLSGHVAFGMNYVYLENVDKALDGEA